MNIYFDFEATQFSERVLAIGASCDNGDFDCLVGLHKGDKLTPFITNLTGITNEMLKGAPNAEEAFCALYNWIGSMIDGAETPIFYHCYGDSDPIFLMNTANKIANDSVRNFVINLAESLLDDSRAVKKFFHSKAIGLHRALKFFEPNLPDQTHDPLDDAVLLRQLMQHLDGAEPLEECPFQQRTNTAASKGKNKKKAPAVEHEKKAYTITLTHTTDKNAKPKRFNSYDQVVDWAYNKILKKSPNATRHAVQKKVMKAIENDANYMSWHWHKEYV